MKTTTRIARLELSTLFYSPIAWFLLVIFMFQCGLEYTTQLDRYLTSQELGSYARYMKNLTQNMFSPPFGCLPGIMSTLYLYVPLLTMGMMSREMSSGTIKLLYSSPVKIRSIILGKYLALLIYNGLLTLVLGVIMLFACFNIQHADVGLLLAGLLAMYLLLCAYSAIGLFMSCLTTYQVVAAISTLLLFAVLGYIGTVWQDIDLIRNLTYFLSISGRTETMLVGLISTKDVGYFVIIASLFLGLSIFSLQAARESRPAAVKAGRYTLTIALALLMGYIISMPSLVGYYDATATESNTLSLNSQKTMAEINEGPLEVTSYINLLDRRFGYGQPNQRNRDMARWEPYLRYKPDITFNYVYYYDSARDERLYKSHKGMTLKAIAEQYARSYKADLDNFKTPEEIRHMIDLYPEQNRYVMRLTYQGNRTFLRLFDDIMVFPSEAETSAALKRLTIRLPVIGFWDAEYERSIRRKSDKDYQRMSSEISFRPSLVNQGFNTMTIGEEQGIPGSIAALVIADPKRPFSPVALTKIKQYIASGGNLLVAGEPGQQSWLEPLIGPMGVHLMDGAVVQNNEDFAPDFVLSYLTPVAAQLSKKINDAQHDSLPASTPGVTGLLYTPDSGYAIAPLLMTSIKDSWVKKSKLTTDSTEVLFSASDGDERKSVPTVLSLTRKINGKEQRIVITGDADFLSNAELGRSNIKTANFNFAPAIFGWFTNGRFPIDTSHPDTKDNGIDLTFASLSTVKIILMALLPGILLTIGAVLLFRRKKQ